MSCTIEKVPDAPIVILVYESRQAMIEIVRVIDRLMTTLDAQPEPVFMVLDIRGLVFAIDDMSAAASAIARRQGTLLRHPNVQEVLMVSSSAQTRLAAQGLRTAVFGSVKIRSFDTAEQALEYCREKIAIGAGQLATFDFH